MEVEDKKMKNHHPSLPSNYVTLAQLQQRWLQQQQQQQQQPGAESQPLQKQQPEQKHEDQVREKKRQGTRRRHRSRATAVPTRGTTLRPIEGKHRNNERDLPENRTVSGTDAEDRRELAIVAGIGDGGTDPDSKGDESKKSARKRSKSKSKVKEKGTSAEDGKKTEGLKEKEKEKVEVDSVKGKAKIESESNEKNSDGSTVDEVEQKFGGLGFGRGELRLNRRRGGGFLHHSQPRRGFYGGRGYGYGNGDRYFGGRFGRRWNEVREKNMVWVKKGENVGLGVET